MTDPIVFSIVGAGEDGAGDARSNSAIKLFNIWSKMLTQMGIVSFVVTDSGQPIEWLTHHADYIAWAELSEWVTDKRPFKLVTAGWEGVDVWELAESLDQRLYLYLPSVPQRGEVDFLNTNMGVIRALAVPNRYIQAWVMARFGFMPKLLTIPTDCTVFYPDPDQQELHKIGFFHSQEAPAQIGYIGRVLQQRGIRHEFVLLKLDEDDVADKMRQCGLFLGLNTGHDPLWGSGYSITHQEAMACGCVPIVFDTIGNREYINNGENAFLIERGNLEVMTQVISIVYANAKIPPMISQAAAYTIRARRSVPAALPSLLKWLDLEEVKPDGLSHL